jgi:hypothetical protein
MKPAILILILAFAGCAKEKSCEGCIPSQNGIYAMVEYSGEPSVDGCDWNLISGSDIYHPDNLDAAFKQHELQVEVYFILTGDFFICGFGGKIPVVHITSIKER